jgi:hypothetical protein
MYKMENLTKSIRNERILIGIAILSMVVVCSQISGKWPTELQEKPAVDMWWLVVAIVGLACLYSILFMSYLGKQLRTQKYQDTVSLTEIVGSKIALFGALVGILALVAVWSLILSKAQRTQEHMEMTTRPVVVTALAPPSATGGLPVITNESVTWASSEEGCLEITAKLGAPQTQKWCEDETRRRGCTVFKKKVKGKIHIEAPRVREWHRWTVIRADGVPWDVDFTCGKKLKKVERFF